MVPLAMPPWSESPWATRPLCGVALGGGVLQLAFTFGSPHLCAMHQASRRKQVNAFNGGSGSILPGAVGSGPPSGSPLATQQCLTKYLVIYKGPKHTLL
jgi:hypothetical protein